MTHALMEPIIAAGVVGLAVQYASRRFTPTDVVDCYLGRIASHDAAPGSFVRVDRRGARCAARVSMLRWIHGIPLSALDGVPVAIQSDIAVRGMPWNGGGSTATSCIATADAECVARLRAAGAIVLGTLNIDNSVGANIRKFGCTPDVPDHARSAGGPSRGPAAAVAAGLCAAALSIDSMGSIRLTAATCGVVSCCLEPGRAGLHGISPRSSTFDTVGVVARDVDDVRSIVETAAGRAALYEHRIR